MHVREEKGLLFCDFESKTIPVVFLVLCLVLDLFKRVTVRVSMDSDT